MKTSFKVFTVVAIFLFMATGAFATNGMRMIGFGPVQRSMGGASVGVNLDAASVLTNPAGIQSLGGRVDFGASYFNPSVKVNVMGTEFTSDKGASPVPALGLVIPLSDKTSFGLGAYGVSGMGVDYNMQSMSMGLLYTSYSLMRFAPGISYKINDMISVGATVNVMYATMEYAMMNSIVGGEVVNMGASSFGYGASIGITVKPVEMLTIGFVYETTSKFQDFKFNQYISSAAGADPGVSENKLSFDQPMNATLGFGLKPIQGLVLAFDVQWIRWSETNGNDLPEFTGGNFDMQWDDQIVYKFGVQYQLLPFLALRAGINYGKMPLSEDNTNALMANMFFPAVAEWHYTVGAGIALSDKLNIGIGYMYSPEAKVKSFNGESKMSQYSLDMGIAYMF
jgi:long-chain fatty acid transport protein